MIVSWNTTNKCNMKCSHCYRDSGIEDKGELTTEQGKTLIGEIAEAGFKIMIFSGGEPLMREDIFELIKYASIRGLRPVLGSNGTLIDTAMAKKLKESGLKSVGISLDSLDCNKHDKFRGQKGAWRDTLYGMKSCRDVALPFQVHTTVMQWNKNEILSIIDFADAMGAQAHHQFFLIPTGRGENIEEEVLNVKEYEELLSKIMEKQKGINIEVKPTCAPQFVRIAKNMDIKIRFGKGCLAGISYCIISPKGDVQPCAYLKEIAGNVKDTPFYNIWKESHIFNRLRTLEYKRGCGVCTYKKSCGGCRARAAYYSKGDYMEEDTLCIYNLEGV